MGKLFTYRDTLAGIIPRWLSGYIGSRFLYTLGLTVDALGESLDDGAKYKFPIVNSDGYFDQLQLGLLGAERGILPGPTETNTQYAQRLIYWRQVRRRKGCSFPLMEQLQAFLTPYPVTVRVITDTGYRYTLAPGGYQYAQLYTSPANADIAKVPSGAVTLDKVSWNWDGTTVPSRFWVLLYDTSNSLWQRDGYWNSAGYWGNGVNSAYGWNTADGQKNPGEAILDPLTTVDYNGTYGSTASFSTVAGLMSLVRDWTPPHAFCNSVIVCFSQSDFNNISPNGTWTSYGNYDPKYVYWLP